MMPFGGPYNVYPHVRDAFGKHWCGPEQLVAWERTLIARYRREGDDDGDGYDVDVYTTAAPARFYDIEAHAGPDSCGAMRPGFALGTGSGCHEWVAKTAKLISEGMVGPR